MSDANEMKFSLTVMINKEKNKVLFAEAGSDFVDVLLSFLTLPLGKIVKLLEKHYEDEAPVIGSLTTLYNGLANLDDFCFWSEGCKQMLMNPRSSFEADCRKLKLDISHTQPTKYYSCERIWNCDYPIHSNISMYYDSIRCPCGKKMNQELGIKEYPEAADADDDADGGVFAIDTTSFIICDDLLMFPNYVIGFAETFRILGITDIDGAELRNVTFGFNEIMGLLKGSLLSATPMSDVILNKRQKGSAAANIRRQIFSIDKIEKKAFSKGMIVKIMVQNSSSELLFAQASEDFVDILFSFLTIPLGGVVCLLGKSTSLGSIDNLYKSIAHVINGKYVEARDRLSKPILPYGYISKHQILPLFEQSAPVLYYYPNNLGHELLSPSDEMGGNCKLVSTLKSPKGLQGNYVKGQRNYIVMDDLTVTPFCMATSVSILNRLNVAVSDVKEVELQIGLEEVLSILKASLTSTFALTKVLNDTIINELLK